MGRSMQFFTTLAQYLFVAAAYGLCVGIAAGTLLRVIAGAAMLGLFVFADRAPGASDGRYLAGGHSLPLAS